MSRIEANDQVKKFYNEHLISSELNYQNVLISLDIKILNDEDGTTIAAVNVPAMRITAKHTIEDIIISWYNFTKDPENDKYFKSEEKEKEEEAKENNTEENVNSNLIKQEVVIYKDKKYTFLFYNDNQIKLINEAGKWIEKSPFYNKLLKLIPKTKEE